MEKKNLEYEDSPSGYVTLYNYKEPFMRFEEGFGYQGVLLFDGETDKVQCHLCGEWYEALAPHLKREHASTVRDYKDAVGLSQSTALIGEKYRAKLIAAGLNSRLRNLTPGVKMTKEVRAKIGATLRRNVREKQNGHGTCPEQLLERIRLQSQELGRTPHYDEIKGRSTVIKVWGSYKNVCDMLGLTYTAPGGERGRHKISDDVLLESVQLFITKHGRNPSSSDFRRKLLAGSYQTYLERFGGIKKILLLTTP